MNAERLLQHYERIADAPDAVARLRRFILELAVRGKLVPQDPADEPASELLKRIEAEKARLVNAKVIRDIEAKIPLGDAKWPCELPKSGWIWVSLSHVGRMSGGMTPSMTRPDYWGGTVSWLSPKDIKSEQVFESELKITERGLTETRLEAYPVGSLFIVARSGILKRTLPVAINRNPAAANQDMKVLVPFLPGMERFLQIMLRGFEGFILSELVKTGTTVQSLKYNEFEAQSFPLPPLAEQQRIVAKVDELMALCDELEAVRTEREVKRDRLAAASLARFYTPDPETFRDDARFALDALPALTARPDQIKQLRQTILNLAVRGKLVPQDPADEPAEELLKLITAERDVLVRQKEIRRDAPLEPVTARDCPHAIPSSWAWSRVGDAVLFTQYGSSQKSHASQSGVPVLTMGNIQDGSVIWGNDKRIPESSDDLPALYLKKFDLLYNRTNSAELVGKTGIYLGQSDARTFASYLIRLRPSLSNSDPLYLNVAMNAPCFRETQIVPLIKKQTGQANVSGSALKNMLIPLPPLAEQHRIVAKVEELMALCDQLETSLTNADETRKKLLDALLAEALAPVDAIALQEAAE